MAYDSAARSDTAALADFLAAAGFSRDAYINFNPDLAHLDDRGLVEHMLAIGLSEHRRLPIADPFGAALDLRHLDPSGEPARLLARALASEMTVIQRDRYGVGLTRREIDAATGLSDLGVRSILVVGDSHSEAYAQPTIARAGVLPLWLRCAGGSAKGLANPLSHGGYGETIRRFLDMAPDLPTLFQFGQVDVEFCHIFRCLMDGRRETYVQPTLSEEMTGALAAYDAFLSSLDREILVAGIFPTTLSDDEVRVAFARAQIGFIQAYPGDLRADLERIAIPTERERNRHHHAFNLRLAEMGRPMVWPASEIVDEDGRVRPHLRGVADHHMSFEPASYHARDALMRALPRP